MTPIKAGDEMRPILFLDVDGPLNPYAAKPHRRPEGYQTFRFHAGTPEWGKRGLRVWLNPSHGPQLLALPFDLDGKRRLTSTSVPRSACLNCLSSASALRVPRSRRWSGMPMAARSRGWTTRSEPRTMRTWSGSTLARLCCITSARAWACCPPISACFASGRGT